MSSAAATPISSMKRVASRSSSIACTFVGSATAMRSLSPETWYGIAPARSSTWGGIDSAATFWTPTEPRSMNGRW